MQWTIEPAGHVRTRDQVQPLKTRLTRLQVFVREVLQNSLDAWDRGAADNVRVRFVLRELTSHAKRGFLESIRAREYLAEAADSRKYELAIAEQSGGSRKNEPAIDESALRALDPSDPATPLRLLLVEDYGSTGLTGAELDDGVMSRFCALCRDSEFSVKRHRQSGGSYGKGKAVLWNHASSRLVFFYSRLNEPCDGHATRFIGIGKLPWHVDLDRLEGERTRRTGRCEFGGDQGFSLLGAQADRAARATGMERSDDATGTTLCLVGFEPRTECDSISEAIVTIAEDFYWPAIYESRIEVEVRDETSGTTREAAPHERTDLQPYIDAYQSARELVEGRAKHELLRVPKRESEADDADAGVTVGCELLEDATQEGEYDNVALIRGFGMVVNYSPVTPRRINASRYAGIVLAGVADPKATQSAEGEPPTPAERQESLLSYAEPEAHDQWNPTMFEGLHWYGAQAAVKRILGFIKDAVTDLACGPSRQSEGAAMPELSKRFRAGTGRAGTRRSLSIRRDGEPVVIERGLVQFATVIDLLDEEADRDAGRLLVRFEGLMLDAVTGFSMRREPVRVASVRLGETELELERRQGGKFAYVHLSLEELPLPLHLEVLTQPPHAAEAAHHGLQVSAELRRS